MKVMKTFKIFFTLNLLIFISITFTTSKLLSHQPVLNNESDMSKENPYLIEKPEISKAIYSSLKGKEHYFKIHSNIPFNFYAGLTIAKLDNCLNFDKFSFSILDSQFQLIKDFNGEIFQWWEWYEPYGKKWYWVGPEYGKDFKSNIVFNPGTYYIKVYNKTNNGNYVLAVGDIEKFTPVVIAKMVFTLPKINKKFWNPNNCK